MLLLSLLLLLFFAEQFTTSFPGLKLTHNANGTSSCSSLAVDPGKCLNWKLSRITTSKQQERGRECIQSLQNRPVTMSTGTTTLIR